MQPKIQYNLTNWVDGMKINRQHFINSENALLDLLRDVTASNIRSNNYGLLSPEPGEKTSFDCTVIATQSRNFKININHCRAVTVGGCRIEIIPGIHPELVSDNEIFAETGGYDDKRKNTASSYFAVISVDPFNRQPFGAASADEYPTRNPYSVNAYRLNLIPEDALNTSSLGAFHIPVARFRVKNDELIRDNNYIPPCASISAHPGTKQIYNAVAESLNTIQEFSSEIVQKVLNLAQNTSLAQNIKKICENNIWHISSEFFSFRTMYRQQSPIYITNSIIQLANSINFSLNTITEKEKEEVLQYFSFWNEISPGKFQEMITTVIDTDYQHENIYETFQPLLNFLKVWADLLEKIKELKLIGQKNEKFDFGGRTMETPKVKEKKFNIFD